MKIGWDTVLDEWCFHVFFHAQSLHGRTADNVGEKEMFG